MLLMKNTGDWLPPPERTYAINGTPGESVFWCMLADLLGEEDLARSEAQINELMSRAADDDNDRLLALLGAMVVENGINQLLGSIMPGYSSLVQNRDFTLSMRIEIARALQLIPKHILGSADTIRRVRNAFAHDLTVADFATLEAPLRQALRDRLKSIMEAVGADLSDRQVFRELVVATVVSLYYYAHQTHQLNDFIRTDGFLKLLIAHSQAEGGGLPLREAEA